MADNYGSFNSSTYPQEVWNDRVESGTTRGSDTTPPYGAALTPQRVGRVPATRPITAT